MAGNQNFEDRLKRIGHDPAKPAPVFATKVQPKPTRGSFSINGILFGGIVAASLMAGFFMLNIAKQPNPMAALASPYLADETPPELTGIKGIYAYEAPENVYQRSCLPFLPDAPDGWVRVTTWDARYPNVMNKLSDIWQAAGHQLDAATGYADLAEFVERFSGPNRAKTNIKGQNFLSSAMYLNVTEDLYLMLDMRASSWAKSNTCKEEFLTQWQHYEAGKKPRYPVLNQFSFATMTYSSSGLTSAAKAQGNKNIRFYVRVSPGLEITLTGLAKYNDPRDVLNGDGIAEKVAIARKAQEPDGAIRTSDAS